MAQRYSARARGQLNPAFQTSNKIIGNQVGDVNAVFDTLISGLETQAGAETASIMDASQRLGLDQPALESQLSERFGGIADTGALQLGAERAKQTAGLKGQQGQLQADRVMGIESLASTLQQGGLDKQEAQLNRRISDQEFQASMLQAERDFKVDKISYEEQKALAAAAARRTASSEGLQQVKYDIQAGLTQITGDDGHVRPEDYHEAMALWMDAGGEASEFINKFDKYVNKSHKGDYYNPVRFYKKKQREANRKTAKKLFKAGITY